MLAELHEAELAFARTRAELAARSDALTEQEAVLAARERAFGATVTPAAAELEALEARIRRLERDGRPRKTTPLNFSAGLRALAGAWPARRPRAGRASTLKSRVGR